MINLDRFSVPMVWERIGISPESHQAELKELEERQAKELVRSFISSYHEHTNTIPEWWMISETFDHIYLDEKMIQKELKDYREEL